MAKPRVFVSHISQEGALAAVLKKHLSRDFLNLLDIFVSSDGVSIEAGEKWLDEVSTALEEAQIELVLCSAESVTRPWINFEAGAAWIRRIRLIPVCHSGIKPDELPVPLKMLNAIVAGEAAGVEGLYRSIAKVVDIDAPAADFAAIAAEIRTTEETMRQATGGIERIVKPRILCLISEQYGEPAYGADQDVDSLEFANLAHKNEVEFAAGLDRQKFLRPQSVVNDERPSFGIGNLRRKGAAGEFGLEKYRCGSGQEPALDGAKSAALKRFGREMQHTAMRRVESGHSGIGARCKPRMKTSLGAVPMHDPGAEVCNQRADFAGGRQIAGAE